MNHYNMSNRKNQQVLHQQKHMMNEEFESNHTFNIFKVSKSLQKYGYYLNLSSEMIKINQLNSCILSNCEVSQANRAKVRLWVFDNCYTKKLTSRTASLACYFFDLYFCKGYKCPLSYLHEFAIACLRIANKLEDNVYVPYDYTIFNKENLVILESQILMKLGFNLNPITFNQISQSLLIIWKEFRFILINDESKSLLPKIDYKMKSRIASFQISSILLNEFLQFGFLFLQSLDYDLEMLAMNAFYLIFCIQIDNFSNLLTNKKISEFYRHKSENFRIMSIFIEFFNHKAKYLDRMTLDLDYAIYLFPIYNALISYNQKSPIKRGEKEFNLKDERLICSINPSQQTCYFQHKKQGFKRHSKKQQQNKRKLSEAETQKSITNL